MAAQAVMGLMQISLSDMQRYLCLLRIALCFGKISGLCCAGAHASLSWLPDLPLALESHICLLSHLYMSPPEY